MTRFEYERKFESYPDLLTLEQFRAMLGGIADCTARKLIRENRVEHFMVNTTYYIPKIKAIDYICSQHYRFYRRNLKHRIK
ncbi:MAG: DNA-binding protein [Clostridia bacterium]|nr:DNA-binding protein [Clostridia bacterium]